MRQNLKFGLVFIVCLFYLLVLSACEEEEAPLQFDMIENSDPDAIRLRYFCPTMGPFPGYKEYYVYTDFTAGEIRLQCNNCQQIKIETNFSKPCVLEGGGNSSTEATAEETGIFVTLEKGNQITIRFADRSGDAALTYGYFGAIKAFGKVGGKDESTTINLARSNRQSQPQ